MADQHPSRPLAAPPGQFAPPPPTATAAPPSPLHAVWGGAAAPVQFRIRYNPTPTILRMVIGSLMLLLAAISFGYSSTTSSPRLGTVVWAVLGTSLVARSIQALRNDLAIVSPSEVRVSQFGNDKTHQIAGFGDLYFAGSKLYRRSDGKMLVKLNSLVANRADVARLKAAVGSAQPASTAPPQTAG